MHRFTLDNKRRKIWIKRCQLVRKDFKFTSYNATRICSQHFVGGDGADQATQSAVNISDQDI